METSPAKNLTEKVEARLMAYLRGGRIHPAALLVGTPSADRWRIAKNIAKQLLCPKSENGAPYCDQCNVCRRIDKEIHPDLFILREPEEDQIKIDSLRELCHQMSLTPMEARAKVCLVDDCHRMNHASANAFLKTLEEPGEGRYFWLLTSQPGSLPETVLSRCVKFTLPPDRETVPFTEEETAQLEKMLAEILASSVPTQAIAVLNSKERTLNFVHYLQRELRNCAVGAPASKLFAGTSPADAVAKFSAALVLEGRLRSNANYGLMLDSYLRQNFLEPNQTK